MLRSFVIAAVSGFTVVAARCAVSCAVLCCATCCAVQADAAVLVISSRKGEYETGFEKGGQTREHAQVRNSSRGMGYGGHLPVLSLLHAIMGHILVLARQEQQCSVGSAARCSSSSSSPSLAI
jgi:hypothetical protein